MLPPEVSHNSVVGKGDSLTVVEYDLVFVLIVRFGAVLLEILRQFYRLLIGQVVSIATTNNTTKLKTNKVLNTVCKPPPFDCVLYIIGQLVHLLQYL